MSASPHLLLACPDFLGASQFRQNTDNQQLSVILKVVQMYKQPRVSIPLQRLIRGAIEGKNRQ